MQSRLKSRAVRRLPLTAWPRRGQIDGTMIQSKTAPSATKKPASSAKVIYLPQQVEAVAEVLRASVLEACGKAPREEARRRTSAGALSTRLYRIRGGVGGNHPQASRVTFSAVLRL